MSEGKSNTNEPAAESSSDYQAPVIEEVVTRDNIEREVAYAGITGGSQQLN